MEICIPVSDKELSQRKAEEYAKFSEVIQAGRRNPIWFQEEFFGIKMIDYQAWIEMETWTKQFVVWLEARATGKTTVLAVYNMSRMMLIPDYHIYISTNSASQSMDTFKKLEDTALKRIPSFKSVTDIFAEEVKRSGQSETGFLHSPLGYTCELYNNSGLVSLSSNLDAIRGKRGSVVCDESATMSSEQKAVVDHFSDVDTEFGLGVGKRTLQTPKEFPLQIIYASSAGDIGMPFYDCFKLFSMKMFLGDKDYFVCDIDANVVVNHSTVDGEHIKPHLTQQKINQSVEADSEKADRELFNHFRKGGGSNAIVKAETIVRNSTSRVPLLYNDTGKKKFIFCYDPARNYDGSILIIFQVINDADVGYRLQYENVISMVDQNARNKTPLPMPKQLEIIHKQMLLYNGERSADYENIEFYIDAGAGGGGVSAVADQLMLEWTDDAGRKHKGIIDPEHKQYETARKQYPMALPIVHLIEPAAYKKIIYGELEKFLKLDLINFTAYDGKDFIMLPDKKDEFLTHMLSFDEQLALSQIELTKNELLYMCRYDTQNGGVQYELAKEKKNKMHDDKAFCSALGAYALSLLRRSDLLKPKETIESIIFDFKKPELY